MNSSYLQTDASAPVYLRGLPFHGSISKKYNWPNFLIPEVNKNRKTITNRINMRPRGQLSVLQTSWRESYSAILRRITRLQQA